MKKTLAILALFLFIGGITVPAVASTLDSTVVQVLRDEEPKKKTSKKESTEKCSETQKSEAKDCQQTEQKSNCNETNKKSECSKSCKGGN